MSRPSLLPPPSGIIGGLSTVAVCAPSDKFLNWAGPLGIGLGGVLVASLGSAFLPASSSLAMPLYSISLYGGLLLFSAFLLYDTQKVGVWSLMCVGGALLKLDPGVLSPS